jgi:dTDP-D-glucose 4,6-dehydratase
MIERSGVSPVYGDLLHIPDELESRLPSMKEGRSRDRRHAIANDKLEHEQPWGPSTQFHQGLADTICWYSEGGE